MRHEWRLMPQEIFDCFHTCWRCDRLAVWDLTWYGCGSPHCGVSPLHPEHRSSHEHYCTPCAIGRGAERHGPTFDDAHIRRVRQHPWKINEEVAA